MVAGTWGRRLRDHIVNNKLRKSELEMEQDYKAPELTANEVLSPARPHFLETKCSDTRTSEGCCTSKPPLLSSLQSSEIVTNLLIVYTLSY